MSQITSTNPRNQVIGYTGNVIARQLREGNASVVQPWKVASLLTWCIVPATSTDKVGLKLRNFNRDQIELGGRVCNELGGILA